MYVAIAQVDDGVDRLKRASVDAKQGTPGRLTADLAVIPQVRCERPGSIVVLADARITPA